MLHAQNTSNISRFEEILNEIANLQLADLERFVQRATQLLEQRKTPPFSNREEELIHQIKNGGPAESFWKEYDTLAVKLEAETIGEEERQLFLKKIEVMEQWSVERLKLTIELSQIWQCSPKEVLTQLNIEPRARKYA
jgi:hypothetical protein